MILSQSEQNIAATSRASAIDLSTQQKQVDKVVEEYKDIFSSPTGYLCTVRSSIPSI
jgi:hypothetical protein